MRLPKPQITSPTERVLDFDIEARPLSWYAGDQTSREVTVIAAQFIGEPTMHCWALGEQSLEEILEGFVSLYNEADIVTGHYIRGFDLPNINGQLLELQMRPLKPKRTWDTKNDLIRFQGHSKSQENLAAMLGVPSPKIGMNQAEWRAANRLEEDGIAYAVERCVGDVRQHTQMLKKLRELGALKPPQMWVPDG